MYFHGGEEAEPAFIYMSCFYLLARMWGNEIKDEGAKAFAEALKNHPTLTNIR